MEDDVMQDIIKISGEGVAPTQPESSGQDRWNEHIGRLRAMFRESNWRLNISMWAAGRVYATLQQEPEYYGLDPEDVPTQKEFGEQYLNRSRTTVQRALKIFHAYDWKWLANHRHLRQTHLLCALDVPEDQREEVLKEVNEGLSQDMSQRESKDLIVQHHPQLEEPETWPKGADRDEIPASADDYNPGDEPAGAVSEDVPDEINDQTSSSGGASSSARDVNANDGSLSGAEIAMGKAYQQIRSWADKLPEDATLNQKQVKRLNSLAETASGVVNMCKSIQELNT